ncbi:NEK11 [Branchiostoma lanceolatum]|uniref:NEK11 protein n=1 Tax=Branchiostoma lanceolatum TaxID=7740 RepID=A0A8J9ZQC1_BRALA|nr:NEK11 [Branchiostoma lanceolatum]
MAGKQELTEAGIDAMKTRELFRLLDVFGVDGDDLEPAAAKTALKQKIRELKEEAEKATSPEQVAEKMADIAKSYKVKRELLLQRCRDVADYLPNLDPSEREKLALHFRRDVMDILGEVEDHLSKDDCPILVAGEMSAGKSTLLNLLLGDDILPVAHMSSTSTICEVKYGETRQALVHLREPDATGSQQIRLTLSEDPEECRQQLTPHIHLKKTERETLPPVSKIEIFWPVAFLKGGVTIVDSPGVGESEMMDQIIAKYIPSAFAFIYIIDSSRGGGFQEDRLGRLLVKCKDQGLQSELEQFDPKKAIFVCNKWDQVPPMERQEVKDETIRKLGEMWEGLDESQVFIHSKTEAVKGGIRSADLNKLLDGIYELLPECLNRKLSTQYRRMVNILDEALKYVRLKLNDAFGHLDDGERRKVYAEALSALSHFDEFVARILEELKEFLTEATEAAAAIFSDALRGKTLRKHLSKVPIKATTDDNAIAELSREIEVYLTRSCQSFKDNVKAANRQFLAQLMTMITRVNREHDQTIRPVTGRRHQIEADDVVRDRQTPAWFEWVGQALRRLNGPHLGSITSPFRGSSLDPEHSDRLRLSEMAIAAMATDAELLSIGENNLLKSFQLLRDFESDLQRMKEVEERLIEERFSETRDQMNLVSKYDPQATDITLLLGSLAMVDLEEMREYEFDLDYISGWQDPQNKIGGGSYGELYRVQIQQDSSSCILAALKVGVLPYALTTEENAWNFLAEEDNLRKLTGDHIVEYYGTAYRREEGGLRLGLVMELCEGTLEDRVVGQREHNPTWWGHDPTMKREAFRYIQDKAIQLCEGLRTIHDAGYIHRDLKLINVLVTGDVVKLADVGVTKREVDVTGTVTGTAIYAAPEVKNRQLYDKRADIYSLGLLLWEMWYGRTVWSAMEDPSFKGLVEGDSMVMPQSPDSVRPIHEWATLVRDCQNKNANGRPSALESLQRIRDMTTEVSPRRSLSFQTTV